MQSTDHTVDTLNSLLRGELSAAETYRQALEKVGAADGSAPLRRLHQEHVQAANTLRQHVHQKGGEPDQDSGAWGTFAKAVEGTAKLFGNTAALKALKTGEESGIKSYEKALEDAELPADCLILIRSNLLPQTRWHIPILDQLMDAR
jgi:uncharacterized protein (TIGR02284 family)